MHVPIIFILGVCWLVDSVIIVWHFVNRPHSLLFYPMIYAQSEIINNFINQLSILVMHHFWSRPNQHTYKTQGQQGSIYFRHDVIGLTLRSYSWWKRIATFQFQCTVGVSSLKTFKDINLPHLALHLNATLVVFPVPPWCRGTSLWV